MTREEKQSETDDVIKQFREQQARHLSMGWDLAWTKAIEIIKKVKHE